MDETRMLRNAQSNLIAVQTVRIAQLEAKLDAAMQALKSVQAENEKLKQAAEVKTPADAKVSC